MKTKEIIFAFVPILLLFFYFYYTESFLLFSQGVLGKLLSVFLIVFYSSLHPLYGFLMCILVIFYFHIVSTRSMYIENMDINCADRKLGETVYFSEDWRSKSLLIPSFEHSLGGEKKKVLPTMELSTTNVWNESCLTGQPAQIHKPSLVLTKDDDDIDKIISKPGFYERRSVT